MVPSSCYKSLPLNEMVLDISDEVIRSKMLSYMKIIVSFRSKDV